METLETERLRLRPWTPRDLETLHAWTSDPRMMRYMGRGPMSRGETRAMLARTLQHYERHGFGVWLAEERGNGEPVGRVGLSYHRAWPHPDPEVGWWIAPERWGEGFATEAGAAAIDYAFGTLDVERVVSICVEENHPSRRVMAKLELRKIDEVPFPELELLLWVHARDAASA